jgi:hypothetical protein
MHDLSENLGALILSDSLRINTANRLDMNRLSAAFPLVNNRDKSSNDSISKSEEDSDTGCSSIFDRRSIIESGVSSEAVAMTPSGWCRIGDLNAGSILCSLDGSDARVLNMRVINTPSRWAEIRTVDSSPSNSIELLLGTRVVLQHWVLKYIYGSNIIMPRVWQLPILNSKCRNKDVSPKFFRLILDKPSIVMISGLWIKFDSPMRLLRSDQSKNEQCKAKHELLLPCAEGRELAKDSLKMSRKDLRSFIGIAGIFNIQCPGRE